MFQLNQSLDAFISSEMKVLVIKGAWGVGKTHSWNEYVRTRMTDPKFKAFTAYSSISLFGKKDIGDIKREISIVAETINVNEQSNDELEEKLTKTKVYEWTKSFMTGSWLKANKLANLNLSAIWPQVRAYEEVMDFWQYRLLNNYLICIDDIERKTKSLNLRQLMGLVDDLAQKKSCKIVLIFNEDSLDEDDLNDFEQYREKIVDLEIKFQPSHYNNTALVFSNTDQKFGTILNNVQLLNIRNIRVLKKVKWVLQQLSPYTGACNNDLIIGELVSHVMLFCWSYFKCDGSLELDFLKQRMGSWVSSLKDEENELKEEELRYREILSATGLSRQAYDDDIINLLKYGYLDSESFGVNFNHVVEVYEQSGVSSSIRAVWDLYADSFEDNLDSINSEFIEIIDNYLEKISLDNFDGIVDFLDEHSTVEISAYVDKYIALHADAIQNYLQDRSSLRRLKNSILLQKINAMKSISQLSIDEIALKLSESRGWNPSDIDFLSSLDKNDYYTWMKGNPDNLVGKVRSGLLIFRNLTASNQVEQDLYEKITNSVIDALKEVGKENELNRLRVERIYSINVD